MQQTHPLGLSLESWRFVVTLITLLSPVATMAILYWFNKIYVTKSEYKADLVRQAEAEAVRKVERDLTYVRAKEAYDTGIKRLDSMATMVQTSIGRVELMERQLGSYGQACDQINTHIGKLEGRLVGLVDLANASELRMQREINELRVKVAEISIKIDERRSR